MTEIKLRIPKSGCANVCGGGFTFCRDAFMRIVDIPEDTTECFLVPTKKITDDCYPITRPYRPKFSAEGVSGLKRIKLNYLFLNTRRSLAKLYGKGYRAVRIEYDA